MQGFSAVDGGSKASFYCISREHWKNLREGLGVSTHFTNTVCHRKIYSSTASNGTLIFAAGKFVFCVHAPANLPKHISSFYQNQCIFHKQLKNFLF